MPLTKRVKVGGAYYEGFELIVSSTPGNYVIDMTQPTQCQISSVSVTPDGYGAGDKYNLTHLNSGTTTTLAVLARNIYNPGAGISKIFDFPAAEEMNRGESMRLTYVNIASQAMSIHVDVEYMGPIYKS
jgi:hypothetical protein